MDISKLQKNTDLAEEGVWVDYEDCRFKIRSTDSRTYRRVLTKIAKRKSASRIKNDPEAMHEMTVEGLADGILVDWENVDANGKPLDVKNREHRLMVCEAEQIRIFLAGEAQDHENFQREATAADAETFPEGD